MISADLPRREFIIGVGRRGISSDREGFSYLLCFLVSFEEIRICTENTSACINFRTCSIVIGCVSFVNADIMCAWSLTSNQSELMLPSFLFFFPLNRLSREKKRLFSVLEQYGPAYRAFVTDMTLLEELYAEIEAKHAIYDPDIVDCTDFDAYYTPTPIRTRLFGYASIPLGRTGPTLSMARRRIGRGGRMIYDRLRKTYTPTGGDHETPTKGVDLPAATATRWRGLDESTMETWPGHEKKVVTKRISEMDAFSRLPISEAVTYRPNSHLNAVGRSYYSLTHRAFLNRQQMPYTGYTSLPVGGTSLEMTTYTPKRPRGRRTSKSMMPMVMTSSGLVPGSSIKMPTDSSSAMMTAMTPLNRQRPSSQSAHPMTPPPIYGRPSPYRSGTTSYTSPAGGTSITTHPIPMMDDRSSSVSYRPVLVKSNSSIPIKADNPTISSSSTGWRPDSTVQYSSQKGSSTSIPAAEQQVSQGEPTPSDTF